MLDALLGRSNADSVLGDVGRVGGLGQMAQKFKYGGNAVGTETTHGIEPTTVDRLMARSQAPDVQNMVNIGMGIDSGPMASIRAYHGSPHMFDRFDMSKIGTGEGAQAYGHGLYFAGNEGVARGYRDALSGTNVDARNFMKDGAIVPDLGAIWQQSYDAAQGVAKIPPDHARAIATQIRDWVNAGKKPETFLRYNDPPAAYAGAYQAAIEPWRGVSYQKNPGHMYEVNINAEPGQLLDWDKPLYAQHPEIQARIMDMPKAAPFIPKWQEARSVGGNVVSGLGKELRGGPPEASAALRDAGIPGIQYLDAGSRGAGDGTRNYVIFDDKLIDILRRYAFPGMVATGAMAGVPDAVSQ